MDPTKKNSRFKPTAAYLTAVVSIPIYVSMYPVWARLSDFLDPITIAILPVFATLVLLGMIILVFRDSFRQESSSMMLVAAGILVCFSTLWVPDPQFPAKKIHVAEYLLLSGIVRFAMSFKLQSTPLLFFAFLFTSILGIHDEFLQGFHSARTFGLRDMTVNALGAGGGSLIWHGLNLFNRDLPKQKGNGARNRTTGVIYLCWLVSSILLYIWPYTFYTGGNGLPFWPAITLIGAIFFYCVYADSFLSSMKHGISMVSFGAFALVFYCLLSNVTNLVFF